MRRFRFNEDLRDRATAAIKLMSSMRHDDGAPVHEPIGHLCVTQENRFTHGQRNLDRVVRVHLHLSGVAANPERAAVPEQHPADACHRTP